MHYKYSLHSALTPVEGRFQTTVGKGIIAIVDYAHTPDALQNVLNTIATINEGKGKIITVVGCGGNRDKGKRPQMASIARKIVIPPFSRLIIHVMKIQIQLSLKWQMG